MTYTPTSWQDDVTPLDAANLNNLENGVFSAYTFFNVRDEAFEGGAKGDGVTDDTAAIQAAINAAAAKGGVVVFPIGRYKITSSLIVFNCTILLGQGITASGSNNPAPPAMLDGSSMTAPIITTSPSASAVKIENLGFYGSSASGSKGIYRPNGGGNQWRIRDCHFNNFGDQAIHILSGASDHITGCLAENSLLVRTGRSGYVGVFDIASTDCYMAECEMTASSHGNDSGSGYICALAVRGTNSFYGPGIQAEISETGVYIDPVVSQSGCSFIGVRADLNYCNGFVVAGFLNRFVGCWGFRNGQSANNSFDGFSVTGNWNTFEACASGSLTETNMQRYGFNDTGQNNLYGNTNFAAESNVTALYSITNATKGALGGSILRGSGSPAGVVSAQPGAIYQDITNGTVYWKASGNALTGWVAMASATLTSVRPARITPTYGPTVTIDSSQGNYALIVVTDGNPFTIAVPTNPPGVFQTQELTVEIQNNSGGAMGAVTWSATTNGFGFDGLTWTNPANTKARRVRFVWEAEHQHWAAEFVSATDY